MGKFRSQFSKKRLSITAMLLTSTMMLTNCFGGGSKVSSTDLSELFKLLFSVTDGDNQSINPRQQYPSPIVFFLSDPTGNKITGVDVKYFIYNITGMSEEDRARLADPTQSVSLLASIIENDVDIPGTTSLTSNLENADQGYYSDELRGSITNFEDTTDSEGKSRIWLSSAHLFEQDVIVIARAEGNELGGGLGHAVVSTGNITDAGSLSINTTNSLDETAGQGFEIWINALDDQGRAISGFRGAFNIKFKAETLTSWAGKLPDFPDPEETITVTMISGKGVIPGGPFTISQAGTLNLSLIDQDGNVPEASASLVVSSGVRYELVAADKRGGPDAGAKVIKNLEVSAGETANLVAAFIDRGGNWLEDAEGALWSSPDASIAPSIPSEGAVEIAISPVASGKGTITIKSEEIETPEAVTINVPAGPQTHWKILTEHNSEEIAAQCFTVTLIAADSNENTNTSVNGNVDFDITMTGTESGNAVAKTAAWSNFGQPVNPNFTASVNFIDGVGRMNERACLYDASNVTPNIAAANQVGGSVAPFMGDVDVNLSKGVAYAVMLSTTAPGDDIQRPCVAGQEANTSTPCMSLNSDTTSVTYYPVITDEAGNYIAATSSVWAVTGPLTGNLTSTSVAADQVISVTTMGTGTLQVFSPNNGDMTYTYEVTPGVPHHFNIAGIRYGTGGSAVLDEAEPFTTVTTEAFTVLFEMYDQNNNLLTNFNQVENITITASNATTAPDGTTTPVDSLTEAVTVIGGLGETTSTLQVVNYLDNTVDLTISSNETHTPAMNDYTTAQVLDTNAGAPVEVRLFDDAEQLGTDNTFGGARADDVSKTYNTDTTFVPYYTAGFDAYGNYSQKVVSSYGATYTPDGNDDPVFLLPGGFSDNFNLIPSRPGSGTVTVTPADTSIPPLTTELISIIADNPTQLRIVTEVDYGKLPNNLATSVNDENAGEDFTIKIAALDNNGFLVTGFDATLNLNFTLSADDPAWAGDAPILPEGAVACVFTAGICDMPGPYRVTNSLADVQISVVDTGATVTGGTGVYSILVKSLIGAPTKLVIADKPGGPGTGAVVHEDPIALTADDVQPFAVALVDAGGNYVADQTDAQTATWTVESPTHPLVPTTATITAGGSSLDKVFNPARVGIGHVKVVKAGYTDGRSPDITISHGAMDHLAVYTQNNGTAAADWATYYSQASPVNANTEHPGKCFLFDAFIRDGDQNEITSYSANTKINFEIQNGQTGDITRRTPGFCEDGTGACSRPTAGSNPPYTYSPPFFYDDANPANWGVRMVLAGQIATAGMRACIYDATDVGSLKIAATVKGATVPGTGQVFADFTGESSVITMTVGAAHHTHIAKKKVLSTPSVASDWYCGIDRNYNNNDSWGWTGTDICEVMNAGSSYDVHAHMHDEGCNSLDDDPVGTWSSTDSGMAAAISAATATTEASTYGIKITPTISTVDYLAYPNYCYQNSSWADSCAMLRYTSDGESWNFPIQIAPGPIDPNSTYIVYNNFDNVKAKNDRSITTVEDFGMEIQLRDSYGNLTGHGQSYNLAIDIAEAAGGGIDSPLGTPPTFPTSATGAVFTYGFWRTSANDFRLPKVGNDVDVNFAFTGVGLMNGTNSSKLVDIAAGPTTTSKILNQSCNTAGWIDYDGLDFSVKVGDTPPIMYHQGFDAEQNCTGGLTMQATPTGVLTGLNTTPEPDVNVVNPQSPTLATSATITPFNTGTGTITYNPTLGGLPDIVSGTITVIPGDVQSFRVTSSTNGATSGVEAAGVSFDLTVTATDINDNDVTDFVGLKYLDFTGFNLCCTEEDKWGDLPDDNDYNFVAGVASTGLSATVYNADIDDITDLAAIKVYYEEAGISRLGQYSLADVTPDVAHHYGINANWNFYPRSDHTNDFSARVQMRDEWGNVVLGGDNNVSLSIVQDGGSWALGTLIGTTTGLDLSVDGDVLLSDLSYDVAGNHKLVATGLESGKLFTTDLTESQRIEMRGNRRTVANYEVTALGPASAGIVVPIRVRAKDNAGNTVLGADGDLNSLFFEWTGGTDSPDGTPPNLPSQETFTSGTAIFYPTFYNMETIATLTIQDNQGVGNANGGGLGSAAGNRSGSISNFNIGPGTLKEYKIYVNAPACNGCVVSADEDGAFSVNINAFDEYGNIVAGDGNLELLPVYISSTGGQTVTGDFLPTGSVTALNLGSGTKTTAAFTYNVGHRIKFDLLNMIAGASVTYSDEVVVNPTIKTVDHYDVTSTSSAVVGPSNISNTIVAKDAAGNTITQIDTALNAQAYNWAGAASSPLPSAPSYGAVSTWSSGSATATHSLYAAEVIAASGLTVTDNFAGTGGARSGSNGSSITTTPATANDIVVSAFGPQVAGVGFTGTVRVHDVYDNDTDVGCSGQNLVITGGNSSVGGHGGAVTAPEMPGAQAIPAPASQPMTTGTIKLFKEESINLSFSACGIGPKTAAVTTNEGPTNEVFLSDSATPPGPSDSSLAEKLCVNNAGVGSASTACAPIYAYFWDAYGNRVDDTNNLCTDWVYTRYGGATMAQPTDGTATATMSGTDYINGKLTCYRDSASPAGPQKFAEIDLFGGTSHIEIKQSLNVTPPLLRSSHDIGSITAALNNITVTELKAFYRKGAGETPVAKTELNASTLAVAMTENTLLDWGGSDVKDFLGLTNTFNCTFDAAGLCDFSVGPNTGDKVFDVTKVGNDQSITFSLYGQDATLSNIDVSPATADRVDVVSVNGGLAAKAGDAFTASVQVLDDFDNLTNTGCGQGLVITSTNAASSVGGHGGTIETPVFVDNAGSPLAIPAPGSQPFTTNNIIYYDENTGVNVTFNACGVTADTATLNVNEGDANKTFLTTAGSAPGTTMAELICGNTGTTKATACAAVNAFFFDSWGNPVNSASCANWNYTATSGATGSLTSAGASSATTLTGTDFIDGDLTCTNATAPDESIQVYGGTSGVEIVTTDPSSLTAAWDNFKVNTIQLKMNKDGVPEDKLFALTGDTVTPTITFTSDSVLTFSGAEENNGLFTKLGQVSSLATCDFTDTTAGLCTFAGGLPFDFIKTESGRSFTATVNGYSATKTGINVSPATADRVDVVSVNGGLAAKAGDAFTASVQVLDDFDNLTNTGCGQGLVITSTNAASSVGGHGGTIEAPVFVDNAGSPLAIPAPGSQPFTTNNIIYYDENTGVNVTFNACGVTADTATLNVNEGDANKTFLTTAGSAPATTMAELICGNTGTTKATACAAVNAFFFDSWGNPVNSASCANWNYTATSGATGSLTSAGASSATTLTGTDFIDGDLTCTNATAPDESIQVYGGTSGVEIVTTDPSSLTAAWDNFKVNTIQLKMNKDGVPEDKLFALTGDTVTPTITFTSDSVLTFSGAEENNGLFTKLGQVSSLATCDFTDTTAGLCTFAGGLPFDFIKTESGRSFTATVNGYSATKTGINVTANTASSIVITDEPSSVTAGDTFTLDVKVLDAFGNRTNNGCANLTQTHDAATSSGDGGTTPAVPTPSSGGTIAVAAPGAQPFTTPSFTFYKEGSNSVTISGCSAASDSTGSITIDEKSTTASIYLSTTDSIPGATSGDITCIEGTTVDCDTGTDDNVAVFAFAWDEYGNVIGNGTDYSCPAWSYEKDVGTEDATLSAAAGHGVNATNSTWHIAGAIKCTDTVDRSVNVDGRIHKNFGWSCGNWSCPAPDSPQVTCTVNNTSGYEIAAASLDFKDVNLAWGHDTYGGDDSGCSGAVAAGNTCNVTWNGVTGQASENLGVEAAAATSSTLATLVLPGAVQANTGAVAPNCTDDLTIGTAVESCVAGVYHWQNTVTNTNGVNSVTFPNADPGSTPVGLVVETNTCKNVVTAGDSCNVDFSIAAPSETDKTVTFDLSADPFFADLIATVPAKDCRQTLDYGTGLGVAGQGSCSASPSTRYGLVHWTVTNNNDLVTADVSVGALTAPACGGSTSCTVDSAYGTNNCASGANGSLAPGESCNLYIKFTGSSGATFDTNFTIDVTNDSDYFTHPAVDQEITCVD